MSQVSSGELNWVRVSQRDGLSLIGGLCIYSKMNELSNPVSVVCSKYQFVSTTKLCNLFLEALLQWNSFTTWWLSRSKICTNRFHNVITNYITENWLPGEGQTEESIFTLQLYRQQTSAHNLQWSDFTNGR